MINHDNSEYTIQLEEIMRGLLKTDWEHVLNRDEIIQASSMVFDFPLDSISQPALFAVGFCLHFRFREIAVTPYSRWKAYLEEYCYNNAGFINDIIESAAKSADIFGNIDLSEDYQRITKHERQSENISESQQNTDSKDTSSVTAVNSTFPQATLNGLDYASGSDQTETANTSAYTMDTTAKNNNTENLNEGENTTRRTSGISGLSSGDIYESAMRVYPKMNILWQSMSYLFFSVL